jgi:hypothetical protein
MALMDILSFLLYNMPMEEPETEKFQVFTVAEGVSTIAGLVVFTVIGNDIVGAIDQPYKIRQHEINHYQNQVYALEQLPLHEPKAPPVIQAMFLGSVVKSVNYDEQHIQTLSTRQPVSPPTTPEIAGIGFGLPLLATIALTALTVTVRFGKYHLDLFEKQTAVLHKGMRAAEAPQQKSPEEIEQEIARHRKGLDDLPTSEGPDN